MVYSGAIVDFYQDRVVLPDGKEETWDFVAHRKGAAAVLGVLDSGKLIMVRQYRPALDRWTLEIPAGARDSIHEDSSVTASRELLEETGYQALHLEKLLELKTTVAFCNEFIDVYLATDLKPGKQHLDPEEFIEVKAYDPEELLEKIYAGVIQDSKTVAGILAYCYRYRNNMK